MLGATSVTATVTAWLELSVPSLATTLNVYEDFVSKSGEALNVTAPVEALIVKAAASAPVRLNVTAPPCTSVAAAVYTTVAALVASGTEILVALVIEGATSVTVSVTAWVLKAPLASEAFTLKL